MAMSEDTSSVTARPRGGVVYGARVVDQLDGRTLRLDLGPPKGPEARGVIVAQGDAATRFNLSAGVYSSKLTGSLGATRLGTGLSVTVMLGARRPDGVYLLMELTTKTR
jgi:hypothetical protein